MHTRPGAKHGSQAFDRSRNSWRGDDLIRLWSFRVALQAERSQAVHIHDHRLLPYMLLLQSIFNLGLAAPVSFEQRFSFFSLFFAHHFCFSGGEFIIMRSASGSSLRSHWPIMPETRASGPLASPDGLC